MNMPGKFLSASRIAIASPLLLSALLAFGWIGGAFPWFPHLQFGPAMMKLFISFSFGTLASVLVIAVMTFLFGRFYCSIFCPLGIIQDAIHWISRRKNETYGNFRKNRCLIAGAAFGLLLGGCSAGFMLLEPYSNFGRIVSSFSIGAALPLLIIATLAVWKGRIYCTAICPVGTLLGLVAKRGIVRLTITDECKKCGQCVKACPASCIDLAANQLWNDAAAASRSREAGDRLRFS